MKLVTIIIVAFITIIITRGIFVCLLMLSLKTDPPQACAGSQRWRHFPAMELPTICSGNNRNREYSVLIQVPQDHDSRDVSPYPNLWAWYCHTFLACKSMWLMEETHSPGFLCAREGKHVVYGWAAWGRLSANCEHGHRSWMSAATHFLKVDQEYSILKTRRHFQGVSGHCGGFQRNIIVLTKISHIQAVQL